METHIYQFYHCRSRSLDIHSRNSAAKRYVISTDAVGDERWEVPQQSVSPSLSYLPFSSIKTYVPRHSHRRSRSLDIHNRNFVTKRFAISTDAVGDEWWEVPQQSVSPSLSYLPSSSIKTYAPRHGHRRSRSLDIHSGGSGAKRSAISIEADGDGGWEVPQPTHPLSQ